MPLLTIVADDMATAQQRQKALEKEVQGYGLDVLWYVNTDLWNHAWNYQVTREAFEDWEKLIDWLLAEVRGHPVEEESLRRALEACRDLGAVRSRCVHRPYVMIGRTERL